MSAHYGGFYADEPRISILGPNKLSLKTKEKLSVLDSKLIHLIFQTQPRLELTCLQVKVENFKLNI